MSDAALVALFSTLPATIAAIGAFVVVLRQGRRSEERGKSADQKLDHITVLTNSTLTAANTRIQKLEEIINGLVSERDAKLAGMSPSEPKAAVVDALISEHDRAPSSPPASQGTEP